MHYPAGKHTLTETLVMPMTQGWSVTGDGACCMIDPKPGTHLFCDPSSRVWTYTEGPAVKAQGANWRIAGLSLFGNEAGEALRISQHAGPFGGSMGRVEDCGFAAYRDAIRIGDAVDHHGNDNHCFIGCNFAHCNAGLVLGARQAMHLTAERWNTRWVKSLVKVEAGGKFALTGLDTDCAGTLLHLVGDAMQLGPNNAIYTFKQITVDAGAGAKTLTLVDQEQPHWLRATFEDVWMPSGPYELRARVQGPDSLLRINRLENAQATMRIKLEKGAKCIIKDSVLPASAAVLLEDGSVGELRLSDCWVGGKFVASSVARGAG